MLSYGLFHTGCVARDDVDLRRDAARDALCEAGIRNTTEDSQTRPHILLHEKCTT